MTHKQIETSREIRLWIGQIIVPAATIVVSLMTVPEVREAVALKANSVKESIKQKLNKKDQGLK